MAINSRLEREKSNRRLLAPRSTASVAKSTEIVRADALQVHTFTLTAVFVSTRNEVLFLCGSSAIPVGLRDRREDIS